MIILYIPFEHSESGDLANLALSWKQNHIKNFDDDIVLLYYKEAFSPRKSTKITDIYICAHGDENTLTLYNHSDVNEARTLNIAQLANRFDFDFLPHIYRPTNIHLYCCGDSVKNQVLAAIFQKQVARTEHLTICSYAGSIYPLDEQGYQYTFNHNRFFFVECTQKRLVPPPEDDEDFDDDLPHRKYFKPGIEDYLEELHFKKQEWFFTKMRSAREDRIQRARQRSMLPQDSKLTL